MDSIKLLAKRTDGVNREISIDHHPNLCPECHNLIIPDFLGLFVVNDESLIGVYRCSNNKCLKLFLGYYSHYAYDHFEYIKTSVGKLIINNFSEIIEEVSPNFVEIFNQASAAEQYNLNQISGVGYRKALEFLIKDYLISYKPEKGDIIKSTPLGNCIKHHVNNPKIRKVAGLALVIGNAETHYVRKLGDRDINDLKTLIQLAINWIEMEIITKQYEDESTE